MKLVFIIENRPDETLISLIRVGYHL